jgi:hypothetical protein
MLWYMSCMSLQQARPLRRLNWMEHKRDMEKLVRRLKHFMHITMVQCATLLSFTSQITCSSFLKHAKLIKLIWLQAMAQAIASIGDMIRSATHDQVKAYIRCIFLSFSLCSNLATFITCIYILLSYAIFK